jgi:uncharacterized protein (DUF427 family)
MSTRLRSVLMQELGSLRHEPIEKRIRATLGAETVVDTTRALLVWEPRRVVPSYAVPAEDIHGELAATAAEDLGEAELDGEPATGVPLGELMVLDPSVPFRVHSTDGEPLAVRSRTQARDAAGFRPADPQLDGYVVLDFAAFDAWYEEDERNLGHPRDPFHRIDIVHSSRHVRVEHDGKTVAESSNACLLFEPPLPVRYYLPAEDVRMDRLEPSDKHSVCAYKGEASYWSLPGEPGVAWSYPQPLREASEITDRIAFLSERVDLVVDGVRLERPVTPWSRR